MSICKISSTFIGGSWCLSDSWDLCALKLKVEAGVRLLGGTQHSWPLLVTLVSVSKVNSATIGTDHCWILGVPAH